MRSAALAAVTGVLGAVLTLLLGGSLLAVLAAGGGVGGMLYAVLLAGDVLADWPDEAPEARRK